MPVLASLPQLWTHPQRGSQLAEDLCPFAHSRFQSISSDLRSNDLERGYVTPDRVHDVIRRAEAAPFQKTGLVRIFRVYLDCCNRLLAVTGIPTETRTDRSTCSSDRASRRMLRIKIGSRLTMDVTSSLSLASMARASSSEGTRPHPQHVRRRGRQRSRLKPS
jgi:hypothetical protein